jgi:hypothetical protein
MSDEMKPDVPVTPAIHTDAMWDGGPQWVEHLGHEPVWVETKAQYFEELNKRGLRIKGMQESSTGPERLIVDPTPPPPAPIRDFAADEARTMRIAEVTLSRYGLLEALSCDRCFTLNQPDGTRVESSTSAMRVECRCGVRQYRAPAGTDLGGSLASSTLTLADVTDGVAFTPDGQGKTLPTTLLTAEDARVLLAYVRVLRSHRLSARWFCRGCWDGRPIEGHDLQKALTDDKIVMVCQCRIRFWQGLAH